MFNVLIVGAQNCGNYKFFAQKSLACLKNKIENKDRINVLTTGDDYVIDFANRLGMCSDTFSCDWKKFGKDAIKVRNKSLISIANAAIIFNDGMRDTKFIHDMAVSSGIPIRVFDVPNGK